MDTGASALAPKLGLPTTRLHTLPHVRPGVRRRTLDTGPSALEPGIRSCSLMPSSSVCAPHTRRRLDPLWSALRHSSAKSSAPGPRRQSLG